MLILLVLFPFMVDPLPVINILSDRYKINVDIILHRKM